MKHKRLWSVLLGCAMIAAIVPQITVEAAEGPFERYTTAYVWSRDYSQVEARYIYNWGEYGTELNEEIKQTQTVSTSSTKDQDGNVIYTAAFTNPNFTTQTKTVFNPDNVVMSWDFETDPSESGWALNGFVWKYAPPEAMLSIGRSGRGYLQIEGAGFQDGKKDKSLLLSVDSPAITLPDNAVLTFWAKGGMPEISSGVPFEVFCSEDKNDMKKVFNGVLHNIHDGEHYSRYGFYDTGSEQRQYSVDLSEYSGKTVYIRILSDVYSSPLVPREKTYQGSTTYYYPEFGAQFDEFEIHGDPSVGWNKNSDGKWLYNDETGTPVTGWQEIDDKWYYFDKSGIMQTGWQQIGKKWYFFNSSGIMQTGWKKSSGKWYYLNPTNGQMVTGWKQISNKWYYFKTSGIMAAKEYCKGYWLNADGTWTYKAKASWKKNSKGWWYGDTAGWYAKNQTLTIDDKSYTFDKNGYCTNP